MTDAISSSSIMIGDINNNSGSMTASSDDAVTAHSDDDGVHSSSTTKDMSSVDDTDNDNGTSFDEVVGNIVAEFSIPETTTRETCNSSSSSFDQTTLALQYSQQPLLHSKSVDALFDNNNNNKPALPSVGVLAADNNSSKGSDDDNTNYYSTTSCMAAIDMMKTKCSGVVIKGNAVNNINDDTRNINDTMDMSSVDDFYDNDEEMANAIPVTNMASSSGSPFGSSNNKKRSKKLGGTAAIAAASAKSSRRSNRRDNFRRNVILAVAISTTLIVLVGLGLGLSTRGNRSTTNAEDSECIQLAENGQCVSNPTYMSVHCPIACDESGIESVSTPFGGSSTLLDNDSNDVTLILPNDTNKPSPMPTTKIPTLIPTTSTPSTSHMPTYSPSASPSDSPSVSPTSTPSSSPTYNPTITSSPTKPFIPGDLSNVEFDIRMSSGLSVKKIAQSGRIPQLGNCVGFCNVPSQRTFHAMMDGAGIVELEDGGFVYVSNSEIRYDNCCVISVYTG